MSFAPELVARRRDRFLAAEDPPPLARLREIVSTTLLRI
jgi:hypothetical protein